MSWYKFTARLRIRFKLMFLIGSAAGFLAGYLQVQGAWVWFVISGLLGGVLMSILADAWSEL